MKLRPILLLVALAVPTLAWGQTPVLSERVARLSYVEGEVRLRGANESAATTLPDRPLMSGDRLVTGLGGLAELALGNATLRLDEQSELAIVELDATTIRLELAAGAASMYLHDLLEDETFEILTPNTAITLDDMGEYRADVSADRSTALTVRSGVATVATASGPVRVAAGQHVRLDGRDALASLMTPPPADAFDEWVLERELRLAEAEPTFTPYEGNAYEELDQYGEWYDEPRYGRVWMPSDRYASWSPYRYGAWQRSGFGWSWMDPSPWGYSTFHGGRWAYLGHHNRWFWVPSPRLHPRHYARDPRPYGQPRGNPRERPIREDGPRTASGQPNVDSYRNDSERQPATRREVPVGAPARGSTNARGENRERSSAPPAAAPPQRGATPPVRPARADPPARSEAAVERAQSRPEVGTYNTP